MKILRHLLLCSLTTCLFGATHYALGDSLDHWTIVSSGTTNKLHSIAFGSGIFVSCGDSGTVLTSSNGLTWLPVPSGTTNSLFGAAYGQDRFVAVGQSGTVITSSNGVVWSSVSSGTPNPLNAVAYTDLGFVAVGGGGAILTSGDGSNWVTQNSGTTAGFVGVGMGFGKTFAGAEVNPPALFWSTNGSVWSHMTNLPQPDLFNGGFAYGNGVLLGIRIRGSFCRSTDGVTWTNYFSPFVYCFGLVFARDQFVTVGGEFSGGGRTIGSSMDGLSWKTRYYQSNEGRLLGVAYGDYRFVAVGDGGSILVSAPMLWLSNPSVVSNGLQMTVNGESGGVYYIQTTTNMATPTWDGVGVVTNVSNTIEFTVPFSSNSSGAFYRAISD